MACVQRPFRPLASAILALVALAGPAEARKAKEPEVSDKPPASLKAVLTDNGPDALWELKIQNASDVPLRVLDDARLLWLEVSLPGQTKPASCRLPDDARPTDTPSKSGRVLRPGDSLRQRIDPRFYCFGAKLESALVPGAQVTPHYGFPSKTKSKWKGGKRIEEKLPDKPPYVAHPEGETPLGPAKNATGDFVVLDGRYSIWAKDAAEKTEPPDEPTLEIARGSDSKTELSVTATVRVRNPTHERFAIFVRRELLTFEVLSPRGTTPCNAEPDARNPERRAFRTVTPGGSFSLASRLVEMCPRGTFSEPGLYLVHARLDAANDGAELGLDAFTGTLKTVRPVPIRVRRAIQLQPNRQVPRAGGAPANPVLLAAAAAGAPPAPPPPPAPPAAPPAPPPPPAPPAPPTQ